MQNNERVFRHILGNAGLVALFLGMAWIHHVLDRTPAPPPPPDEPRRIVSLAPSITETLYAMGSGDEIAGVTKFCDYPPDVVNKPRVAGFSEVHYEAVLRVLPDLIALPADKTRNRWYLEQLGLPTLGLNTLSLAGLLEAVEILGRATGRETQAMALRTAMQKGLDDARHKALGRSRPRVLFSVMHAYQGLGYISEITAVGQDGFYSELIHAAGGENVYQGSLLFPRLSREALIFLNPDVIVDVIPPSADLERVRQDWRDLASVNAIRDDRLVFLTDGSDTVPGPRFLSTLNKLSLAFHPEANRETRSCAFGAEAEMLPKKHFVEYPGDTHGAA